MVSSIAFYIEGGGDQRDTKDRLREAFSFFLAELRSIAADHNIGWKIVACGGRPKAYKHFCTALAQSPGVLNVLVVDAESHITENLKSDVWGHLRFQDGWACPDGATQTNCYLMLECMETWIVADKDNLVRYYGKGFRANQLPKQANVEDVPKVALMAALNAAVANTNKRDYHKTRHGFDLLKSTNPKIVQAAASQCKRMFTELARELGGVIDP